VSTRAVRDWNLVDELLRGGAESAGIALSCVVREIVFFSLSGNFSNRVAPLDGMRALASLVTFSCYVCCGFVTPALLARA
jgi:hypothetical protein